MNAQAKHCGELLRRQRVHRGWSQARLAEQIGTVAAVVSKWERGISIPRPYYREKLCLLYGLSGEELGFVPPPSEQQEAASPAPSPAQPDSTPAGTAIAPSASSSSPVVSPPEAEASQSDTTSSSKTPLLSKEPQYVVLVVVPQTAMIQSQQSNEMNEARRETMQGIGTVVSGAFLPYQSILHIDAVERLARVRTKPSSLDAETLQAFKATTQSYRFLFARGLVAIPCLLEAVIEHFNLIVQLLKDSPLPTTRTALSAIASETAEFTARLSVVMHLDEQAEAYFDLALFTAQEANNDALYASALGRIGWLKTLTGHPEEALVYLEEAQRIVQQCAAYTLVCWSAVKKAEAHADLAMQSNAEQPDDRDCLKALEMAHAFAERIQPGEETFGFFFNSTRLAAYQGSCYMRLRRSHLARPALFSGLRMTEPFVPHTHGILLDLATTNMQEQEIEQACSHLHQALDLILPLHEMRDLHRVRTLREQLEPWAVVEAVRNLNERLHASLPDAFLRK